MWPGGQARVCNPPAGESVRDLYPALGYVHPPYVCKPSTNKKGNTMMYFPAI